MRLRDLITDEEYAKQKQELLKERILLEEKLNDSRHRADTWLDLTEKTFNFANQAKSWFENGSQEEKKTILEIIGSNLFLKDKKLFIEAEIPFHIIEDALKVLPDTKSRFEPPKDPLYKRKKEAWTSLNPSWCSVVDEVRIFWDTSDKANALAHLLNMFFNMKADSDMKSAA